jgi:hypothetical protein
MRRVILEQKFSMALLRRTVVAQGSRPGEIVPQSGIYTITHDAAHADIPHDVTVIKGWRFLSQH